MKTSNPFDALLPRLQGLLGGAAAPAAPPAPAPAPPPAPVQPANPFAGLMEQMPTSGWGNPDAQAWMQQALASPYMQGWGGQPAAGGAPPAQGTPGTATGPRLASDIQVSDAARKMVKQFRNAKDASSWDWKDIGSIAAQAGLAALTGGGSLAATGLGLAGSVMGADAANKATGRSVKQIKRLRDRAMAQLGYSRVKKGGSKDYVDAQGNVLGGSKVFQILLDAGYLG